MCWICEASKTELDSRVNEIFRSTPEKVGACEKGIDKMLELYGIPGWGAE